MSEREFSVYQFFVSGEYERVREWVTVDEAIRAATHYCSSIAAQTGIVTRVIITDGGDSTVLEWKYGEGITWPPRRASTPLPPNNFEGDPQ